MKIEIGKDFPKYFKPSYPEEFDLFSHFEVFYLQLLHGKKTESQMFAFIHGVVFMEIKLPFLP